jgi:hypothetical protein
MALSRAIIADLALIGRHPAGRGGEAPVRAGVQSNMVSSREAERSVSVRAQGFIRLLHGRAREPVLRGARFCLTASSAVAQA